MYESCRKHNFSYIVFYIYIYIYIQVFSNIFMQNQRNTQKNNLFQEKTTKIIVYFRWNDWKQIVLWHLCGYFVRFALYLRKSPCSATITGKLHMISWRNRPRKTDIGVQKSPLPGIYPPPPGYALRLAVWRLTLIFQKIFGIICIESKGEMKQIPNFWNIKIIKKEKNHVL